MLEVGHLQTCLQKLSTTFFCIKCRERRRHNELVSWSWLQCVNEVFPKAQETFCALIRDCLWLSCCCFTLYKELLEHIAHNLSAFTLNPRSSAATTSNIHTAAMLLLWIIPYGTAMYGSGSAMPGGWYERDKGEKVSFCTIASRTTAGRPPTWSTKLRDVTSTQQFFVVWLRTMNTSLPISKTGEGGWTTCCADRVTSESAWCGWGLTEGPPPPTPEYHWLIVPTSGSVWSTLPHIRKQDCGIKPVIYEYVNSVSFWIAHPVLVLHCQSPSIRNIYRRLISTRLCTHNRTATKT